MERGEELIELDWFFPWLWLNTPFESRPRSAALALQPGTSSNAELRFHLRYGVRLFNIQF
jgi:hypothetical protein